MSVDSGLHLHNYSASVMVCVVYPQSEADACVEASILPKLFTDVSQCFEWQMLVNQPLSGVDVVCRLVLTGSHLCPMDTIQVVSKVQEYNRDEAPEGGESMGSEVAPPQESS